MIPPDQREPLSLSAPFLAAALLLWAVLAFGHGLGLDIVTQLFDWARTPGALSAAGGQHGALWVERLLAVLFAALALGCVVLLAWRLRAHPVVELQRVAVPWLLWASLLWLAWKSIIIYTTELVHFAQYALIAFLLSLALGRGRRPQLAFAAAFGLGIVDEVWQHYGLHVWVLGEHNHYLDWSDPLLNGLGACGGVLPVATWLRLRGQGVSSMRFVQRVFAVATVLLLPLLLVDPATLASWMGSYHYYPFWDEYTNSKPVHWLTPYEGVPLVLAGFLFLAALVDPRRRTPTIGVLAVIGLLGTLAVRPPSRMAGTPVHEPVPRAIVPHAAAGAVVVDGHLDEPAWARAPRLGPFQENATGAARLPDCGADGRELQATYARLLWTDTDLLIAFEATDTDVWARPDHVERAVFHSDEGVQVLVDDGGEEVTFYEFGLNPANRASDAFFFAAAAPLDYDPWGDKVGLYRWQAPEVRSAVAIDGSLDEAWGRMAPPVSASDVGYGVELAIPWEVFRTSSVPSSLTERSYLPPQPGQRWRLGLYRMNQPRVPTAIPDSIVAAARAAEVLGSALALERAVAARRLTPGEAGYHLPQVWNEALNHCIEVQAWSPTYLDLLRPSHFGVIEFAAAAAP